MIQLAKPLRPLVLVILDGWGVAPESKGNAISQAQKPFFDSLLKNFPNTTLKASGEAVGLPDGEVGNSEVGHLNLGAGRVVVQDLTRINQAISDGSFFQNQTLLSAFEHVKRNKSNLHLMGLVGTGTVHASTAHLYALLVAAKNFGIDEVLVHLFTDGRDSPPRLGIKLIDEIEEKLAKIGNGRIASITGRYWAIARDNHWDRTAKTYQALVSGRGRVFNKPKAVFEYYYVNSITDEFIEPSLITSDEKDLGTIKENDSIVFFNYRKDRPRQITKAFVEETLTEFDRGEKLKNLRFTTMTSYEQDLPVAVLFPQENIHQTLAEVVSERKLKQLHIGESEKYAHVTYFFNGGREEPFTWEERVHIPSPKVFTYDLKPEMAAIEITNEVISRLETDEYQLYVVNYANADMVGHTGSISATVKAIETLDECLSKIVENFLDQDGIVVITADHGNAERKLGEQGELLTEHSGNKVPLILVSREFAGKKLELSEGLLADVAPTVLGLMGLSKPSAMTGRNLLENG